jgi:hypothetical protein
MGIFGDDVKSGLDRMFDYNRDGKIDATERMEQYEFMYGDDSESDFDEDDLDDDF